MTGFLSKIKKKKTDLNKKLKMNNENARKGDINSLRKTEMQNIHSCGKEDFQRLELEFLLTLA